MSRISLISLMMVFFIMNIAVSGQSKEIPATDKTNFEVFSNRIDSGGRSGIRSRDVYVFIEESKFSYQVLKRVIDELRFEYCNPFDLKITVYSDKEMLKKLANVERQPLTIDFSDNPGGREASGKLYKDAYPRPTGYFRADYFRYGAFEYLRYSPEKGSLEMLKVDYTKPLQATSSENGTSGKSCQSNDSTTSKND